MAAIGKTVAGHAALSISGMTCSGCVNAVARALSRVPGGTGVQINLDAGRAQIMGNASSESLLAAVEKAGYGAQLAHGDG